MIKKEISRSGWKRVKRRQFVSQRLCSEEFRGVAGLIKILEVTEPLYVPSGSRLLKVVDDGYYWLQLAPDGEYYWVTAAFDERGNLLQLYFDITWGNHIYEQEEPWFFDLYLDVVQTPGGEIVLLDEDELEEALTNGTINQEQYNLAYDTARNLMSRLKENPEEFLSLSNKIFRWLLQQ